MKSEITRYLQPVAVCMFSKLFTKEAFIGGLTYFVVFCGLFLLINKLIDYLPNKDKR